MGMSADKLQEFINNDLQVLASKIANEFSVDVNDLFAKSGKGTSTEILNAKSAFVYLLRQKEFSYGDIGKVMNLHRSFAHQQCKVAESFIEKNLYHFKEKIDNINSTHEPMQIEKENSGPEESIKEQEITEKDTFESSQKENGNGDGDYENTPEPINVADSPLSEKVIVRNLDVTKQQEIDPNKLPDDLDDYQRFEAELDGKQPIEKQIPQASFEPKPENPNPNKVTVQMDDETADFSTTSILNMVKFGSVEMACFYACVPEREVTLAEQDGKVPPNSTTIVREKNDKAREKLEHTADKKITLLIEPLKKVLKKKNVVVSPEVALVLASLMFLFSMFMTAKDIRKDSDYFLEKLYAMNNPDKK